MQRLRREQPAPGTQHHGLLQQQLSAYPSNLTLGNMFYFLCAPTLCYQTDYPRSTRFRKRWFMRRCIELLVCGARSHPPTLLRRVFDRQQHHVNLSPPLLPPVTPIEFTHFRLEPPTKLSGVSMWRGRCIVLNGV